MDFDAPNNFEIIFLTIIQRISVRELYKNVFLQQVFVLVSKNLLRKTLLYLEK